MAAYNRLHGTHCSQHERLLTTILRDEWGWDGVVISDWFAVHATAEPALAGLDLEMPGPPLHWGAALAAAVDAGEVPVEVDRRQAGAARAPRPTHRRRPDAGRRRGGRWLRRGHRGRRARPRPRRSCCCATRVCCRWRRTCGRIAVVGPNGDREVIQGGGSARVTPTDVATVADGLRERLGAGVTVEPGLDASRGTPAMQGADLRRADGTTGVDVEIVGADGEVRGTPAAPRLPRDVPRRPRRRRRRRLVGARASASYRPRATRAPTASR